MAQWQRLELDKLREEHLFIFQCTYITDKPVLFDKIQMGVKHASQAACDSVFMLKGIPHKILQIIKNEISYQIGQGPD